MNVFYKVGFVALFATLSMGKMMAQDDDPCPSVTVLCADGIAMVSSITAGDTPSPTGVGGLPDPASCTGGSGGNGGYNPPVPPLGTGDVWYALYVEQTVNAGNYLDITTSGGTDIAMAIYTATNSCSYSTFSQIACSRDATLPFASSISPAVRLTSLAANQWIYIRIWDEGRNATPSFNIAAGYFNPLEEMDELNGLTTYVSPSCYRENYDQGGAAADYSAGTTYTEVATYCAETPSDVVYYYTNWLAGSPVGEQIELAARTTGQDYLTFFDGPNTSSPMLGVYTGSTPNYPQPGTIISSGQCLTLRFTSNGDGGATLSGWHGSVLGLPNESFPNTITLASESSILDFYDPGGALGDYDVFEQDIVTYCPPAGSSNGIWAAFDANSGLETNADYLYVYDGVDVNAPLIGIYTGGLTNVTTPSHRNSLGTIKATSANTSGCLTFKFVTDGTINFSGWHARISSNKKRLGGGTNGETCATAIDIVETLTGLPDSSYIYAGFNVNSTGTPGSGAAGVADPYLDPVLDPVEGIESCASALGVPSIGSNSNNITRLESTRWYTFTTPANLCSEGFLISFENFSCQNINESSQGGAGAQFILYRANTCQTGANWGSAGAPKLYCQDKISQTSPPINLSPFIVPNTKYYVLIDGFTNQHCNFDVVLKLPGDNDRDGICDVDDIDDDNDAITDVIESGCLSAAGANFGSGACSIPDPSRDLDGDGIPNYKDPIDNDLDNDGVPNENASEITGTSVSYCGGINLKGVCSSLDFDSDGVINQYDLDADNDGIQDVVEGGGADANGDGIIDCVGTCDADGDGLLDPADLTVGPVTTTRLPVPNTDGNGGQNFLDLDADNDAIPDVVESGGEDVNGDGVCDCSVSWDASDRDGWCNDYDADLNNDGDITDPSEGNAKPMIITGADTNNDAIPNSMGPRADFDGDTRYNYIDLDADADGISDVVEARGADADFNAVYDGYVDTDGDGFVDAVDPTNGHIGDEPNDGSTPLIRTPLDVNNDGRPDGVFNDANQDALGNPDYLDIDADDDGIVDNVEGQSTTGYIKPTGTDTDGDGIDNAYDAVGFGNGGLNPHNFEGTGLADYRDLDDDDDGVSDRNEAWDGPDGDDLADAGFTCTSGDTDNDGLLDCFDAISNSTSTGFNIPPSDDQDASTMVTPGVLPGSSFTPDFVYPNNTGQGTVATQPDFRDYFILPAEIISFTGEWAKADAQLQWVTASESNTSHFEVERMTENNTFVSVGSITAAGNSSTLKSYNFTDKDAMALGGNEVTYRLLTIDLDGSAKQSDNVVLNINYSGAANVVPYPNPARNEIYFDVFKVAGKKQLIILDMQGSQILEMPIESQNDTYSKVKVDVSKLAPATYIYRVVGKNASFEGKFVKE